MFNDRDLSILGAGALLAVLCLFLPLSFVGKIVVGFLVLVGFMVVALLRLGPDRVPPEVWLMRRVRYSMQARQYINQQTTSRRVKSMPASTTRPEPSAPMRSTPMFTPGVVRPVDLAWGEVGVYPLLTALLGVLGTYFLVWLARGGAEQLAIWFR
jgi:hypothetical protein